MTATDDPGATIPDFSGIDLGDGAPASTFDDWATEARKTAADSDDLTWETPEGIGVSALYAERDLGVVASG